MPERHRLRLVIAMMLALMLTASCATVQSIAALRQVDFSLDRVSAMRLAGVDLARVRSYNDLRTSDIARITLAVANRNLPLEFNLHVRAENPAENQTTARLIAMSWSLFLQDRETVSGNLQQAYSFPPGQAVDMPIAMSLDLMDYFQGGARELVDLVLAATGQGGEPTRISLRAVPTVDTPLGPIRYPEPITIASRTIGNGAR
jgi:hypothetical protein